MHKKYIFWDWNGTLLDDVLVCVDCMNSMLRKRSMKEIDHDYYKTIFNFPVKGYYESLGFDFNIESFEELSIEFIAAYNSQIKNAGLHAPVLKVLQHFRNNHMKQIILSAMEQKMLENLLNEHNIRNYFTDVIGLSDIYANSKVKLAQKYIYENNINPDDVILIGDTLHDAEVAENLGIDLILVSNGHHGRERLSINGYRIIDSLEDILTESALQ